MACVSMAESGVFVEVGGVDYGEHSQIGLNPELKTSEKKLMTCSGIICCLYGLMVKEDCRNNVDTTQRQLNYDEGLYCTLCNAEVGKLSKHCSSCDKCVDGFDHHCRWLNNCIGRKNYVTFLLLMATSLSWVAVECGVGIAVLVRCFVNKTEVQNEVVNRLGDVFSRILVIVVVTICTALALIAMVPLGELFFFHMILIKKGITTYDFVMAMRTQSEPPMHEQHHSLPSSPASSTPSTMNKPEEIMAQLEGNCVPSNIDPDAPGATVSAKSTSKLPTIRISVWKLLKLNSKEAMKGGAMARASSSFFRPISSHTNSLNSHQGTPTLFPFKGSYSLSSSTLSNPLVMKVQQHSSTKHFNNPIYRSSTSLSPCSTRASDGEESMSKVTTEHKVVRSGDPSMVNTSSSVYWDQEAGRFVSSQNVVPSSSRSGSHAELVYSGNLILFGGPSSNEKNFEF